MNPTVCVPIGEPQLWKRGQGNQLRLEILLETIGSSN